jgi:cell shape-determining protein MreC
MTLTTGDILGFLYIVVAVMIIIVLYHILFIVVDVRKMLRRFDTVTAQIEEVILKPISIADQLFQWLVDLIEQRKTKDHHHVMDHHHHRRKE